MLHRSFLHGDQPEGSIRFALNAVSTTQEGSHKRISNELSNEQCQALPAGSFPVGNVYTRDNSQVVFLKGIESEIGIIDKNCNYKVIVRDNCLNFNKCNPVDAIYRLVRGCEDVIYFTDGINPPRSINLEKLHLYKDEENKWDCSLMNLRRDFLHPCYTTNVISGGQHAEGSYIVSIRYLDENLNPTQFILSGSQVKIYGGTTGEISVGFDAPINKSIELIFSELDNTFPYYQIAVTPITNNSFTEGTTYLSPKVSTDITRYVLDGNYTTFEVSTLEEIRQDGAIIDTAKYITQADDSLLLGNVTSKNIDVCGLQLAASKISTKWIRRTVPKDDYDSEFHPNHANYLEHSGFMADEVVPLGIVFVYPDGYETPAFHIPGRGIDCYNGEGGSGQTGENCLIVRWDYLNFQLQDIIVLEVSYSIGDEDYTKDITIRLKELSAGRWFSEDEELIVCDDNITNVSITEKEIQVTTTGTSSATVEENTGGGSDGQVSGSWDNTIYTSWNRDFLPYISRSEFEAQLKAIFLEVYGEELDDFDDSRLNSAEFLEAATELVSQRKYYLPRRWEVYNTAFKETDTTGAMGYHECKNALYSNPQNSDCLENGDYWGVDDCGISLEGKPIRHHRIPDRRLVRLENANNVYPIGVEFSNIEYPDPDIIGHYFVTSIPDRFNRTVLDNGIVSDNPGDGEVEGFTNFSHNHLNSETETLNTHYYTSPKAHIDNFIPNGYVKYIHSYDLGDGSDIQGENINGAGQVFGGKDVELISRRIEIIRGPISEFYNDVIDGSYDLGALAETQSTTGNYRIVNTSWLTRMKFIEGLRTSRIEYVSVKSNIDVHCNLDSITYRRLGTCNLTLDDKQEAWGGLAYITNFHDQSLQLSKIKRNNLNKILALMATALSIALSVVTAGLSVAVGLTIAGALLVVGLTTIGITQYMDNLTNGDYEHLVDKDMLREHRTTGAFEWTNFLPLLLGPLGAIITFLSDFDTDGSVWTDASLIHGGWVESYCNWDYLNRNVQEGCIAPYRLNEHNQDSFLNYMKNKVVTVDSTDDNKLIARIPFCPTYYQIPEHYRSLVTGKINTPVPSTYDCCSNCIEQFPNRVYQSDKSFQEELTDSFKVFKANNYKDYKGEHGVITGLFENNNNLMIHFEEALKIQPKNYQERVVDEIVTIIGTGGYFDIPTKDVIDSDIGAAGNQDFRNRIKTPYGIFFIDEIERKPYLLSNELKDLSNEDKGLDRFFKMCLKRELHCFFPEAAKCHSRLIAGYDSVLKRILFTKVDYKPKEEYQRGLKYNKEKDSFSYTDFINNAQYTVENISIDSLYFDKIQYTMSYSFIEDGWFSWHSYIPDMYLHNKEKFYTIAQDNIWRHHVKGSYQTFYNKYYPFIVEPVLTSKHITFTWESLYLQTIAERYDDNFNSYVEERYITFNKFLLYNRRQSTKLLELSYRDKEFDANVLMEAIDSNKHITRTNKDWRFNMFRDQVTNYKVPIFNESNKDWTETDKELNSNAFDKEKHWSELEKFRDKYLTIRLIFDKFDNIQLTYKFVDINKLDSVNP